MTAVGQRNGVRPTLFRQSTENEIFSKQRAFSEQASRRKDRLSGFLCGQDDMQISFSYLRRSKGEQRDVSSRDHTFSERPQKPGFAHRSLRTILH